MSNLRKRLLAGVGILGLVGATMVVGSPTAEAQTAGVGAVVFQGCTTNLDPAVPAGLGQDSGDYAFATGSNCGPLNLLGDQCVAAGALTTPETAAGTCTISASGTYSSLACGTGTTGGGPLSLLGSPDSATTTVTDLVSGNDITVETEFGIAFVAGVGVIAGTPTAVDGTPVTTGATSGVVHITATQGDCVTTDVEQFAATGAAIVAGTDAL